MSTPILASASQHDDHQPPQDIQAEQSVLGAMLLSPDAIAEVSEQLTARDFYRPAHAAVFSAVLDLYGRGEPADAITVSAELQHRGELARVGGAPYLHTLINVVPTAANAGYYAQIVREKADLRQLVEIGTHATQMAVNAARVDGDVDELLTRLQGRLDEVSDRRGATTSGMVTFDDLVADRLAHLDDVQAGRVDPGLPTPYLDLTEVLGGLKPGQLVTVAARPGVGKSTAALDFARHTAFKQHKTVALFSLEMSAGELWDRIICAESRVRFADYGHRGRLSADDRARIDRRLSDLHPYRGNLVIDDDTSATPAQIRARARQIKRKQGLALVIVDYLQLMTPTTRNENRQQEVSELSRQMKLLAKELEVPVLMLSQLNRASEQRADKRPMLADMRESGAIEQDSDIVMLLHRPDSQQRDDARAGEVDLILAKNRGGPTSTITIAHQLHYCRFADLAIT